MYANIKLLRCTSETNMILCINYISIKKEIEQELNAGGNTLNAINTITNAPYFYENHMK